MKTTGAVRANRILKNIIISLRPLLRSCKSLIMANVPSGMNNTDIMTVSAQ
jgi:hypothetical protein